jgi:hypothetical protein
MIGKINFLIILLKICYVDADLKSSKIVKDLIFNAYDKTIRPTELVYISIDLEFRQIINFDEKSQILVTSSYLNLIWKEPRLSWNVTEYSLAQIMVQANQLWLPDLYVINSADIDGFIKASDSVLAQVNNDGLVFISHGLNSK